MDDPTIKRNSVEPEKEKQSISLVLDEQVSLLDETNFEETNLNLSSVKGYKEKRKDIKYLRIKNEAIIELKKSLKIFKKDELKLNHSVVLFCCQIVEDLFTSSKKGQLKKSVVIEVCKEFFDDKEDLVEMVIDLIFDKIVKSSFLRRNKNKIKSLGFFLLSKISPDLSTFSQSRFKAL